MKFKVKFKDQWDRERTLTIRSDCLGNAKIVAEDAVKKSEWDYMRAAGRNNEIISVKAVEDEDSPKM